jgi:hypothetical protein
VPRLAAIVTAVSALLLGLPGQPAAAATRVTEPLPLVQGLGLTGVCGFPVLYLDRGGRTLTTLYGDQGEVLQRDVRGSSTILLTNPTNGVEISIVSKGAISYRPNADGTWTQTQTGSGLSWDTGSVTGAHALVWYGGRVVSTGALDQKTLVVDVVTQQREGWSVDLCESLLTGLKPRH